MPRRQKPPAPPPRQTGYAWWIVGALGVAAVVGYLFLPPAAAPASESASVPTSTRAQVAPASAVPSAHAATATGAVVTELPKPGAVGPLPPLPLVDYSAPRPPDVIRAVYEFAARHPEVLRYVPCYCGCERFGHRGNDDCFVASRDAQGNVAWEPHGMT